SGIWRRRWGTTPDRSGSWEAKGRVMRPFVLVVIPAQMTEGNAEHGIQRFYASAARLLSAGPARLGVILSLLLQRKYPKKAAPAWRPSGLPSVGREPNL
ncbi:MAG: hypothetical protein P4L87_01850, partial [Formivibrio sp.]|nr:hypothetical protein [Formivibrio sp.]